MRFDTTSCPDCGAAPGAIEEQMTVDQEIAVDEAGEYEYTGGYRDYSETVQPVEDAEGRLTLVCSADSMHRWPARAAA